MDQCRNGDGCKFKDSHTGAAGSRKAEVQDAEGYCLMEQQPGGCRRNKCPLRHRAARGRIVQEMLDKAGKGVGDGGQAAADRLVPGAAGVAPRIFWMRV